MLRHSLLLAAVFLGAASTASADGWAEKLFDTTSHDFGATPHGPLRTHTFTITNTTSKPVHIASVRVSCGCLSTALQRTDLAPGQEAALVVNMDTNRFRGYWAKVVYVRFDQPESAEVKLTVGSTSRDDLTFTPGTLAFDKVAAGSAPKASVTMTVADAKCNIADVKCDSAYVQPQVNVVSRDASGTTFQITAQLLHSMPAGSWYSTVWLTTDNPTMPRMSIPVTAEVTAPAAPAKTGK
jgi:Protein of unknown function (DUF1573)